MSKTPNANINMRLANKHTQQFLTHLLTHSKIAKKRTTTTTTTKTEMSFFFLLQIYSIILFSYSFALLVSYHFR